MTRATRARCDAAWLPAAAVLIGAGWGSNQFTPMLLVYRQRLGLGTGTLEALFGVYALGLIPGLLIGGPLSDARGRRSGGGPGGGALARCEPSPWSRPAAPSRSCSPGACWRA